MSGSPPAKLSDRQTGCVRRQVGFLACASLASLALLAPGPAIAGPPHSAASSAANTEASLPPPARKPGWWAGTCDKKRTPGSKPGPIWHGLVSCGPGSIGAGVYETGPLSANVEWQCVELIERWLYLEFKLKQVVSVANDSTPDGTNGYEVVRHYAYAIAHAFKPGHYPLRKITPSQAQKAKDGGLLGPGDVVSYGNVFPGHTNLVEKSTVGPKGNGEIRTLNQNLPLPGGGEGPVEKTIQVRNWNFSIYDLPATGWLHVTGALPKPVKKHENPGPATKKFQRCAPPPPFPQGKSSPPLLAKNVSCAHARQVVSTWNQQTGSTCHLDGSSCLILEFTCSVPGPNFETLVCSGQDGAEIRLGLGNY